MKALKHNVSRFMSHYGMLFVLVAICGYYSASTLTEQHPEGADAGKLLAKRVHSIIADKGNVLIVARQTDTDNAFVTALDASLRENSLNVVEKVQGEPRDLRIALENLAANGKTLQ